MAPPTLFTTTSMPSELLVGPGGQAPRWTPRSLRSATIVTARRPAARTRTAVASSWSAVRADRSTSAPASARATAAAAPMPRPAPVTTATWSSTRKRSRITAAVPSRVRARAHAGVLLVLVLVLTQPGLRPAGSGPPELAVVPGDRAGHVDLGHHPLVQHGLNEGPQFLVVGPVVPLEHADPELPHLLAVLHDLGRTHDLDPAQLLVVVAVLDHAGDTRVAAKVDGFLGLGFGLDGDTAVDEPVPHGHRVDRSVVIEGAHGHRPALVEEGVDLLGGHGDEAPLVDAVAHRAVDLLIAHPSSLVALNAPRRWQFGGPECPIPARSVSALPPSGRAP